MELRNIYFVDIRNHGYSPSNKSMKFTELAGDVYNTFKDIVPFTLFGFSIGCSIGIVYSQLYPETLDGLILLEQSPASQVAKDEEKFIKFLYKNFDEFSKVKREGKSKPELVKLYTELQVSTSSTELSIEYSEKEKTNLSRILETEVIQSENNPNEYRYHCDLEGLKASINDIFEYDFQSICSKYKGPVKVINGGNANPIQIEDYATVYPQILKEDMNLVSKAGHLLYNDNPEETKQYIIDSLEKIDSFNAKL